MAKNNFFRKTQKRRYASKKFKNPYFQRGTKRSKKPLIIAIASIIVIIAIAVLLFLNYSKTLLNVEVSGMETISEFELSQIVTDHLNETRLLVFKNSNSLIFDKEGLIDKLNDRYLFESLEVKIQDTSVLLSVKEKTSQLIWFTDTVPYLVDLEGSVIRGLTILESSALNSQEVHEEGAEVHPITLLPIFRDLNDGKVKIGSVVLSPDEIENIFRFHKHLEVQNIYFIDTRIDRLSGKWMSVTTVVGYSVLFDPEDDVDAQAVRLQSVLKESVGNTEELEYIDLRFGDHVYFK